MFCCLGDWGSSGTPGSDFPGQRRYAPMDDNKLAVPPPGMHPELVSVNVPQGSSSGDTITVQSPSSGRTMQVIIPDVLGPQNNFMVEFPPVSRNNESQQNSDFPHDNRFQQNNEVQQNKTTQLTNDFQKSVTCVPVIASTPDNPSSPLAGVESRQDVDNDQYDKHLILVQVPPGTAPGSTLHVQVPGEDRLLAVKVPAGVSRFHVAYEPIQSTTTRKTHSSAPVLPSAPFSPPPIVNSIIPTPSLTSPSPISSTNNQKQSLMLVKVPPGVLSGTTIQVQVPGEDRMVSAQVPPGVSEFHVAYEPQQKNVVVIGQSQTSPATHGLNSNNRLPNNSNYNNGYGNNNNHYQGYKNNSSGGGGGMGYVAPVLAGAALMGGAGYLIHQHNQQNNEDNDDGADYNYNDVGEYNEHGGNGTYYENDGVDGNYDDSGGGDYDYGMGGDY